MLQNTAWSTSIFSLQPAEFRLYPRFTEFLPLSKIYRVPISIQGLQSSRLYPGFTEFLSLSRVYRVLVSIQGLQSFCLSPGFTEFPSLSRVYRVPVSIQDSQNSRLFPGYTEFPSLYFPCFWQGEEKHRETPSSLQNYFLFFS